MTKNGTVEINKAAEQHANHRTQSVKTQHQASGPDNKENGEHLIHYYLKAASGVKIMRLQKSFTDMVAESTHYNKHTLERDRESCPLKYTRAIS